MPEVPFLTLFPYLRIEKMVVVGPWVLQRIDPSGLASENAPRLVRIRALLSRLRDPEGRPLGAATLVARRPGYPEPDDPEVQARERYALQAAVSFATVDANAYPGHAIDWSAGPIATAEVAHFFTIEMDLDSRGAFAMQRGGAIYRKLVGGGTIFDEFVLQPAPEGLLALPELRLDDEMLDAIYQIELSAWSNRASPISTQVSAALHWLNRAWENSPTHTMPDVLVQLKTAIEALSGEHRTSKGITKLEAIYAAVDGVLGSDDYLGDSAAPTFYRDY